MTKANDSDMTWASLKSMYDKYCNILTHVRSIVHEDDLLHEMGRRSVHDRVDRPQEGAPSLIVKANDHAGGGKV